MKDFPNIAMTLRTLFNSEDGLPEDVSVRLYQKQFSSGKDFGQLKLELQSAFQNPHFPWKSVLCNSSYEVYDAETDDDAREFAKRVLWDPIFES